MKPSIGRIVHYVIANGQHRTAEVVNGPFNDGQGTQLASLRVTLDAVNDIPAEKRPGSAAFAPIILDNFPAAVHSFLAPVAEVQVSSVRQDEEGKTPGTWHWPERE